MPDYLQITTGDELIAAGVIPKSSSQLMALITHERLKALRDRAATAIDPTQLGDWQPLLGYSLTSLGMSKITDSAEIRQHAQIGMPIRSRSGDIPSGHIVQISNAGYLVVDANGRERALTADEFILIAPDGEELARRSGYVLAASAVADAVLGHKIRFSRSFEFRTKDNGEPVAIAAETIGTLTGFEDGQITIHVVTTAGAPPETLKFDVSDYLASILQVSSLGQLPPRQLDEAIREDVVEKFFPTTVLEQGLAKHVIIGLLMGKDLIFNGPPGSGKTNVVEDLRLLLESYAPHLFKVAGCQVQCDPFSLWSEEHQGEVAACPECQIRHDGDFRRTNRFRPSDPANVQVTVAKRSEGMGIEQLGGNVAVQLSDLTGFKPPRIAKDGTVHADASDPEGFQAGKLVRTNNGLLIIDEIDKLHHTTMDGLLNALAKERVMPADLRAIYPAHALVLGTSNDASRFSNALRDRILLFEIGYPSNPDVTYEIIRRAHHGESAAPADFPIGDVYRMPVLDNKDIAFPVILERAVSNLFTRLRASREVVGLNDVMVSSRSMLDALVAAGVHARFDRLFDADVQLVSEEHVVSGITYAITARITADAAGRREVEESVASYVAETLPKLVDEEIDAWWCTVLKNVAIVDDAVPVSYAEKFADDLRRYRDQPSAIIQDFRAVHPVADEPETALQWPLMSILFREHPGIAQLAEDGVEALVLCLLEYQSRSKCQL